MLLETQFRHQNAYNFHCFLQEDNVTDGVNQEETDRVKELILSNSHWIRNDYEKFVASVATLKNEYKAFLTLHTADDLRDNNVQTYQLEGYNIGYALYPLPNGEVDIVSVFNTEPNVRGIVNELLKTAVENGGTQLDHYDTKLSELYLRNGFQEVGRDTWNDDYASPYWNYEKFGKPDVVYRKFKQPLQEMYRLLTHT